MISKLLNASWYQLHAGLTRHVHIRPGQRTFWGAGAGRVNGGGSVLLMAFLATRALACTASLGHVRKRAVCVTPLAYKWVCRMLAH